METKRATPFTHVEVHSTDAVGQPAVTDPQKSKTTNVEAPRTLPLPVRAPSHPSGVLDELVRGGFITADDQAALVKAAVQGYNGAYDIAGGLTDPNVHLCTGALGDLAGALAHLDVNTLSPGERTARGSVLFWLRSEIVGGGGMGAQNASSFRDY